MSPLHALTLGDVLREHARSWPQHVAAVDGDTRLTYPQLDARENRLAHGLHGLGVGAGDRVLWLGQNSMRLLDCLQLAGQKYAPILAHARRVPAACGCNTTATARANTR